MTGRRARTSVTVVSGRRLYREALACVLSHLGGIEVVGLVDGVRDALARSPDVVMVAFSDGSGIAVVTGAQLSQWVDDAGAPVATPVAPWDAEPDDLGHLVRIVHTGGLPVPDEDSDRLGSLTPREAEVLGLLVAGWNRDDLAESLGISVHTVRTHVGRILAKLGVDSTFEAVAVARAAGLRALREEQRV